MREIITIEVPEGETLQMHLNQEPVGPQITVPNGVTSVTVIVRDTEGLRTAQAEREARREGRRPARRASPRAG